MFKTASRLRAPWVSGLLTLLAAGLMSLSACGGGEKDAPPPTNTVTTPTENNAAPRSLWQVIDIVFPLYPYTKDQVEQALNVSLVEDPASSNSYFIEYATPSKMSLADGVIVTRVTTRYRREGSRPAFFRLALEGSCVRLADVTQHHPDAVLVSSPRGDSLDEMWMYGSPANSIRLGFKDRNRECLAYVGMSGPDA